MGKIHEVQKLTDNPYVNLYQVEATSVHQTPVSYYVASRAVRTEDLKLKTRENRPDGVIIAEGGNHTKGNAAAACRGSGADRLEMPCAGRAGGNIQRDISCQQSSKRQGGRRAAHRFGGETVPGCG